MFISLEPKRERRVWFLNLSVRTASVFQRVTRSSSLRCSQWFIWWSSESDQMLWSRIASLSLSSFAVLYSFTWLHEENWIVCVAYHLLAIDFMIRNEIQVQRLWLPRPVRWLVLVLVLCWLTWCVLHQLFALLGLTFGAIYCFSCSALKACDLY